MSSVLAMPHVVRPLPRNLRIDAGTLARSPLWQRISGAAVSAELVEVRPDQSLRLHKGIGPEILAGRPVRRSGFDGLLCVVFREMRSDFVGEGRTVEVSGAVPMYLTVRGEGSDRAILVSRKDDPGV